MFSRVTQLEVDPVRASVEGALKVFSDEVLPDLEVQPGYEGVYVFANEDGRGMLVSFWDSEEAAAAGVGDGWYSKKLEEHVTLFRAPPGRDRYQVLFADPPEE
jgi:heme-degrading monooxygenase HmoA